MDIVIGFLMLLFFCGYGGYALVAKDFNYDLRFILQMAISAGGSLYLLVLPNLSKLKSFFTVKEKEVEKDIMPEKEELEQCNKKCCNAFAATDKDMQDYFALIYLKNRAKEIQSQEMLDLVVKLNSLLFSTALQDKQ